VTGAWRLFMPLVVFAGAALAAPPLSPRAQAEDFEAMWRAVDAGYAYFGASRAAWKHALLTWKPRAARAATRSDFVAALEGALDELRDDNVSLSETSAGRARRVPYDTDIRASWKGGDAVVESVRTFGDADVAGLRPGHVVTRVADVPIRRAVAERLGAAPPTPSALDWGLRQVLAGPRSGTQRIEVREGSRGATLDIERTEAARGNAAPILARRMGDARDIGYLRVRIGSADEQQVENFDGALDSLKDTRALILDLRESVGPGSRALTRAILARFAAAETRWRMHEPRDGTRVADSIAPRGSAPFPAPLVVLADRWTAGEGEALVAGLHAVAHARIVGTAMAGLRGELREVTLPHSAIVLSFPGEQTFLANGEPLESLRPDVTLDLAAPQAGPGDPILYQALKLLEPCPGRACRSAPGSPPPARGSLRR
jgi:C-terminal processing protease CtpA/Prc